MDIAAFPFHYCALLHSTKSSCTTVRVAPHPALNLANCAISFDQGFPNSPKANALEVQGKYNIAKDWNFSKIEVNVSLIDPQNPNGPTTSGGTSVLYSQNIITTGSYTTNFTVKSGWDAVVTSRIYVTAPPLKGQNQPRKEEAVVGAKAVRIK